jgi:hypothetical protein
VVLSGRKKEEDDSVVRKIFSAATLSALILVCSAVSLAQSKYYVLTNDENTANSASVFNLDTANGKLSLVQTLETGGEAYSGGYYAAVTQAVSPDAACLFVADGGSGGDIAAFSKATGYAKVGNYVDSQLYAANNMPIIENSAGTLLYVAYEFTSNIGVWTINPDCSLVIANIYDSGPFLSSMAITHDGSTLITTYQILKYVGTFTISGNTLTENVTVPSIAELTSIAVTDDDQVVIFGTAYSLYHNSTVVTASLPGLTNQQQWKLGPGYSAGGIALSPAGAAGNGCLYIGNTGDGSSGTAGVTGVHFTENPLKLSYANNVTSALPTYVGTITTINNNRSNGAAVYAAESAGYLGVYSAASNCAVTLVNESLDPNSTSLFSLSAWAK